MTDRVAGYELADAVLIVVGLVICFNKGLSYSWLLYTGLKILRQWIVPTRAHHFTDLNAP